MPFNDSTFDYIFGELFIHHSHNLSRIISEAARVLRSGGRRIFLEPAVPGHFAWLFSNQAKNREAVLHIHEDLISLTGWRQIVKESELPQSALRINTNGDYQVNPLFTLEGRLISYMPSSTMKFFPVGAVIDYEKP